ncbi:PaaX family transcriptional regulator C-terminal domain-containing protein [Nocardia sp. NPDC047648]|uniref:PaaX family transcriptional regulator n=1 Tax=Nocardia sp. NPDC047648 TaxID=3155625 RepID=UPI00340E4176
MTPSTAAESEAQPRELIVTLFGLYARGENNWLAVSSLVRLMAELGIDGPAVRSSVSRLKRRDVLTSVRRGGVAGYSLSEDTLALLAEGDTRIFHRQRAELSDGWLLLVFSVPESEREKRHELRTSLLRSGFGAVAPGAWIAPGHLTDEVKHMLHRKQLTDYVELFEGHHVGFEQLRLKVRRWWDFDQLAVLYADFVRRYRPVLDAIPALRKDPARAFAEYVPTLTTWRRLPYLDPGLPLELLPQGWNGLTAESVFTKINNALSAPAREFALDVIHQPSGHRAETPI